MNLSVKTLRLMNVRFFSKNKMKKCAVYEVENCYLQRRDFDLGPVIGCGPGCTAQMLLHAVVDSIEIVNKARNDELTLSDSNVLLRVSHDSVRHAARCSHARLTVPWSSKYEMLQIKTGKSTTMKHKWFQSM